MGSKKVRIVITGDSKMKALEEARKWVLQLEKEVLEQRRNCRTRGLILLGTVLLGAISDEDVKFQIYEQFIEIDALQKSKNSTAESKKAAKEKAGKTVIGLAKALSETEKRGGACRPGCLSGRHGSPVRDKSIIIMWKPYVRFSSFCSGVRAVHSASAHASYLTREKECLLWGMESRDREISDRREAANRWKEIAEMETGLSPLDTPAGRARHDACVQVRLFLPLPNLVFDGMTKQEIKDALTALVRELELDSTDVMWSLHKGLPGSGKKERDQNLHLHISYRPRNDEGHKHRISIRREVISLREALGGWLQERGYEIDWQSVSKPGKRRHISPEKIAMAERGEPLNSPGEQLQANLTLAKRLVAKLTREEARRILLELLRSEDAAFSRLEEEISSQGWSVSRIRRGKRDTWILKDGSGKELALRRILNCKEEEVHRLFMALQARDAEKTPSKEPSGMLQQQSEERAEPEKSQPEVSAPEISRN